MTMTKKNLYVLDTNVPEYDPQCLTQFQEHDVMILASSMTDLAVRSTMREGKKENIKEFFNEFEIIKADRMFSDGGISIGTNMGNLHVVEHPYVSPDVYKTFTKDTRVGRLLAVMHMLTFPGKHNKVNTKASKRNNTPIRQIPVNPEKYAKVVLISRDPSIRAAAAMYEIIAEPYKSDRIDKLYTGVKYLDLNDTQKSSLYEGRYDEILESISIEDRIENRYFTILDPAGDFTKDELNSIVIWQYRNSTLNPILPKDFHSASGIKPRNLEQRILFAGAMNGEIPFLTVEGRAGTGKTLIALAVAIQMVEDGIYDSVIITRNSVGVGGSEQGFYPGSPEEKTSPYLQSFYDNMKVINKMMKQSDYCEKLMEKKKIEVGTFELFRGRTFNRVFVIVDETQNLDKRELVTVASRIGDNSKMVLMGDVRQIDDQNLGEFDNGLSIFIDKMKGQSVFAHIKLVKTERSKAAEVINKVFSSY